MKTDHSLSISTMDPSLLGVADGGSTTQPNTDGLS
jgi:hypothetical protein